MEIDARFPTKLKEIFVGIIRFLPRVRLKEFQVSRKDNCSVLALEVGAAHGGEKLEMIFPPDHEMAVSEAMEHLLQRRTP